MAAVHEVRTRTRTHQNRHPHHAVRPGAIAAALVIGAGIGTSMADSGAAVARLLLLATAVLLCGYALVAYVLPMTVSRRASSRHERDRAPQRTDL